MHVIKRDGHKEEVSFDKVLRRIQAAGRGLEVNPALIAQKVLSRIYDGVKTSELDELAAHLASSLATVQPDYGKLAAQIAISNHQANTCASFSEVALSLANQVHPKTGKPVRYISTELEAVVRKHGSEIDAAVRADRDFLIDYFGFKTLERAYLLKDVHGKVVERPQHMWMRVALGIWGTDLAKAFETYDMMSMKRATHATPTLFNAGTPNCQLSSCYLVAMSDDSISGIYKTLADCAQISKHAGGIGLHVHNIRAKGSLIAGTNGVGNGLTPMLRVYNSTARYVDQCFTPETLIYTQNGPKPIEDVGITDKVLTSDGTYHNVNLPVRHEYKGKLTEIQLKHACYPVRVTGEHQIYALKGQTKGVNFSVIRNRLDKDLAKPEFYDANELEIGDMLVFPIPTYEADIEHITEDDCRMYGILLGDGYITKGQAGAAMNTITKVAAIQFVTEYLENRGIHVTKVQDKPGCVDLRWSTSNPGFKFTRAQLYDAEGIKYFDPAFLHLPKTKILQIIRGLIETDGCVGEKEIAIEMTSYSVIESLRYLLLRLGALSSGYERNRIGNVSSYKHITTRQETIVLRVPRIPEIMEMFPSAPKSEWFTYMRHGNNIYARIQDLNEVDYEGIVHDFEIAGPHDYTVAHMGVAHNGGGRRHGSFAIYLEPWHADIEDFLRLKLNTGADEERARDLFYAIWMNDLFMERVEAGADWTLFCPAEAPGLADAYGEAFRELYEKYEREGKGRRTVPAQKLWFKMLDAQIETGTPYIVYKDAANAKSNQKNLGTIKSSNLCVAPETYILTDKGHIQISELVDQTVNVWNGDKWSETTVRKTGEQQKLITVYLSNGAQITCTPYHKFLIRTKYSDKGPLKDATRVEASSLKEGMKLAKFALETIEGDSSQDIKHPYTHGFFCGDGTVCNTKYGGPKKRITLYGEKKQLIDKIAVRTCSYEETAQGTLNVMIPDDIPDKYTVPISASVKCRLEWLAGLLDSDGCVCRNGSNESFQITSIHFEFLDRVRLMLQTLGVQSKVIKSFDERVTLLPDGKGGRAEYNCKALWRMLISSSSLYKLKTLGLTCHRLVFDGDEPQRNAEQFVTVVSVIDNGRIDDTYCFNEPENHAGVFNGILTGNCTEIVQFSSPEETAVCNLASVALPAFVNPKRRTFDFDELRRTVRTATRNLNRVIDINYYPTPETRRSNMRHRPIGLGVQGLADVFAMLRLSWESEKAANLNQRIFEHIYYAALSASADAAAAEGPYETFAGSPASEGVLQYDMWGVEPLTQADGTLDWAALKARIVASGLRNSLLVAPMPTASTSQILGWNECFEPFTSNIYTRRTLAGEFIVVNKHLVKDLMELDLWSEELKQRIIANNGSVQGIAEIPISTQERYKTAYEIKQRTLIDMAAARGAFICQSQSLNLFVADPTYAKLTSMHFYGWKKGLKTGIYYLRTKAPTAAQKFTVDPELLAAVAADKERRDKERLAEDAGCTMCSA